MYQQHKYRLSTQFTHALPVDTILDDAFCQQIHIELVCRKSPLTLRFGRAVHYLLPLSNNLMLLRGQEARFGMRLPMGLLWPTAGELELHCQHEGKVGIIDCEGMRRLLLLSAETRTALLQAIGHSLQHVNCELEQYACSSLTGRTARLLLALDTCSRNGSIHYAHTELAALLNAQRESVSVIIGRFRRQGLVTTSYGRIHLNDPAALQMLTEQY